MFTKEIENNGISFAETGEIIVTETRFEEILETSGYDIYDGDTVDSTKVCDLAWNLDIKNLGGFLGGDFLFFISEEVAIELRKNENKIWDELEKELYK